MYWISQLLLLILVGCTEHVGCVVLTSSPLTATDGELFTLICSSTTPGVQDRQWKRDGELVITTTHGSSSPTVSNPDAFNRYLSGRVNVSCDNLQHNVTLRINSDIDNGSQWQCVDNQNSQTSNTMTINMTETQTTLATTSTSISVTTTTTTDTSSARSTGVTETQTTLATTSTSISVTTTTTTDTSSSRSTASGVAVSQTATSPTSTGSTSATTSATTNKGRFITPNGGAKSSGQDNTIGIAAGAAGAGVAVIVVVIVVVVCIRKRRRSVEEDIKDKTRRDRTPSRSAEMLIESGVTEAEEIVMHDNMIYTSSPDVTSADYGMQDHNPVVKDVYTQVKKVKKPADQHVVTDVYATPNKGVKKASNTDVYAKVNKVKKTTSDHPKDTSERIEDMYAKPQDTSERIEDMYAKPQKGKRNQ